MTGGEMPDADDRRPAATPRVPRPLNPKRIEEIRARIEADAYKNEAVLQATARAILERGDLQARTG
jgi:hypothetical protein